MENIFYLRGDATKPVIEQNSRIIVHICNDVGAWGKGFVLAIEKEYPIAKTYYKQWYNNHFNKVNSSATPFKLGEVQIIPVESKPDGTIYVANMIAQHNIYSKKGVPPIRYKALKKCLKKVKDFANVTIEQPTTIHMPKIGCGLAKGDWNIIGNIIKTTFTNIPVYIYGYNWQSEIGEDNSNWN